MAQVRILDPLTGRVVTVDLPLPAPARPSPRPAIPPLAPPARPVHGESVADRSVAVPPAAVPAA